MASQAFIADSLGPSEFSTGDDWLTFATDPRVICLADTHLLADVTLTLDLGHFEGRTTDQGLALSINQRRSGLAHASLLTVLVIAALSTADLKCLVFWTGLDLDTLSTQECVVRVTNAHLSTFLGSTAARIASEAF